MAWQLVAADSDDFYRPDSTTVGNGWSQGLSGTFNVSAYGVFSGTCGIVTGGATRTFAIHRPSTASNHRAVQVPVLGYTPNTLTIYVGRRDHSAIVTVGSGYGYYVTINFSSGTGNIYRATNGTPVSIASLTGVPVTAGTHYRIERWYDDAEPVPENRWKLTFLTSPNGADWTVRGTAIDSTYMTDADPAAYGVGVLLGTTSASSAMFSGNIENFLVFEESASAFNVAYDEQGGAGVANIAGATEFTTPVAYRFGYRLTEWNTASGGSGTSYAVGSTYTLTEDLALYAIWSAIGELGIYVNGTLEVPGDGAGITLGEIGSEATFQIRAKAAGHANAAPLTVNAPAHCQVSKDGGTWAASVTYAIGEITDTDTTCYVKRAAASPATATLLTTAPRLADVWTEVAA